MIGLIGCSVASEYPFSAATKQLGCRACPNTTVASCYTTPPAYPDFFSVSGFRRGRLLNKRKPKTCSVRIRHVRELVSYPIYACLFPFVEIEERRQFFPCQCATYGCRDDFIIYGHIPCEADKYYSIRRVIKNGGSIRSLYLTDKLYLFQNSYLYLTDTGVFDKQGLEILYLL